MSGGTENSVGTVGFGVRLQVPDSCVSRTTWPTAFITHCRVMGAHILFTCRDIDFISTHEIIEETCPSEFFATVGVVGDLALGKQDTRVVDIECYGLPVVILQICQ